MKAVDCEHKYGICFWYRKPVCYNCRFL